MGTAVAPPKTFVKPVATLAGRRFDHVFFSSTALLMLASVFVGFAPTYFLAGVFNAPLPNTIIHIHGAVFSTWILLLVTQTSLVSAHRVDIHKKLGIAAFMLACSMVVIGVVRRRTGWRGGAARPALIRISSTLSRSRIC